MNTSHRESFKIKFFTIIKININETFLKFILHFKIQMNKNQIYDKNY